MTNNDLIKITTRPLQVPIRSVVAGFGNVVVPRTT